MLTAQRSDLARKRKDWLDRKNLTLREFADSVALDYNTTFRWFDDGRGPKGLYLKAVQKIHKDFPVK